MALLMEGTSYFAYLCKMDIFPTQNSTLSSAALNTYLQEKYGLGQTNCRLLIKNVSDTYLLEGLGVKYIFKIYRDAHRSLNEIKAEIELLDCLADGGAKVAQPIAALDGRKIQSFQAAEGLRNGVLFTYAKGTVVQNLNDAQLKLLGREMAKVHQIAAVAKLDHPRKTYTINSMLAQPLAVFKPAFEGLEAEYAYLEYAVHKVKAKLAQLDLSIFAYGYCHYDFLPKNFHFEGDENITFFDFDFAGKGHLVNDIASFYIHYFMEVLSGRLSQEEADRAFAVFVAAYSEENPLLEEELATVPLFGFAFWIFYLGFQYENFDDWSNLFFGPKYLKDRVALIKKWMDWYVE